MKYEVRPTEWSETYRLYDENDKFIGQGDYPYCSQLRERYEYCDGKPLCADCNHAFMDHLVPSTLKLKVYQPAQKKTFLKPGTYTYYACDHSEGCMDMGCDCKGYRLPGYPTIVTDWQAMGLIGEKLELKQNPWFDVERLKKEVEDLKSEVRRIRRHVNIPPMGCGPY